MKTKHFLKACLYLCVAVLFASCGKNNVASYIPDSYEWVMWCCERKGTPKAELFSRSLHVGDWLRLLHIIKIGSCLVKI